MTAKTPVARVAAFAALAQQRGVDLIDWLDEATLRPKRVQLHTSDLLAVLDALADACEDHMRCEGCGAAMCETCGVGDIAACPADRVHCTSPWCFDDACMHEAAVDDAIELAEELALDERGGIRQIDTPRFITSTEDTP